MKIRGGVYGLAEVKAQCAINYLLKAKYYLISHTNPPVGLRILPAFLPKGSHRYEKLVLLSETQLFCLIF